MLHRGAEDRASAGWFFNDRPIRDAGQDLLNHRSIAEVLKEAIESAEPPCMIGLLAEFGKGKSSTTNIAAEMLRGGREHDVVTVTADKHSGNERARNLVHSIAAELERLPKMKRKDVAKILQRLRHTTQVRSVDPTETPVRRLLTGDYPWRWLAVSFLPFGVVAIVIAVLALIFDGAPQSILGVSAALPPLWWLAAVVLVGPGTPLGTLHKPARRTEETPRAEAADEIEEVFGELVDLHHERTKKRLVVIVDDIDRLSSDDLLDALRVLRSLQSVPRGQEPVFVISCNEDILTTAVGDARRGPAPLTSDSGPSTAERQRDDEGTVPHEPEDPGGEAARHRQQLASGVSHDDPALAFIDKLLTVRVRMPPPIRGDMRRFAQELIPDEHPIHDEPGLDLEKVIAVLIHDDVDDPRTVVRLLNRFVGAYLLGHAREEERAVYPGDVIQHPDVLAQLCVLIDEFPKFHAEIVADPALLLAAHKVALHQTALSASETAALSASDAFGDNGEGAFEFRDLALRRYISATALRIRYPEDISPLVYMANTHAGRTLGRQMHSELRSGVASGDHLLLTEAVSHVPADRLAAAGQAIADMLQEASAVDASTYLASVAPSLSAFEAAAEPLADACVGLLDRSPEAQVSASCLTAILDHVTEANDESICRRLLAAFDDPDETNERHAHAAKYLAGNPRVRPHVEGKLIEWLRALPNEGSWGLGREWLDPAEHLDTRDHSDLLTETVTAMAKSIRSEQSFTSEDGDRFVRLAETALRGHPDAAPRSSTLVNGGPNTRATFVRLWQITGFDAVADDCLFAAETAADQSVAAAARRIAVELVAEWVDAWESAEYDAEPDSPPEPISGDIVQWLVDAAQDAEIAPAVLDALETISAALDNEIADALLDAAASITEHLLQEQRTKDAESAARKTIEAAGHHPDLLDRYSRRLLEHIDSESDPSDPAVRTGLGLIAVVASTEGGEGVLEGIAAEWRDGLRLHGEHDGRTRTRGFQELRRVLPRLVDENADPILSDLHQRIASNDDPANRLRTVTTFPWPDQVQVRAAEVLDEYWDSIEEGTQTEAFGLFARIEPDEDLQARFHPRLVNATEADPYSRAVAIAIGERTHMSAHYRRSIYVAAVGRHENATRAWGLAAASEIADTVAGGANDGETAKRLIEALPDDRRSEAATSSLHLIVTTDSVPDSVVAVIAAFVQPDALQAAADAALTAIEDGTAALASSLRVLSAAKNRGATVTTRRVTSAAVKRLPEASVEAAAVFGQLLQGVRIRGALADVLRDMRQGQPAAQAAAEALTTARSRRR